MEQKVTDFTTTPPTERELTPNEELLLKHMQNIAYAQRLEKKVSFLEERLTKVELELEELKTNNAWLEYSEQDEELTLHGKTEPFFE